MTLTLQKCLQFSLETDQWAVGLLAKLHEMTWNPRCVFPRAWTQVWKIRSLWCFSGPESIPDGNENGHPRANRSRRGGD